VAQVPFFEPAALPGFGGNEPRYEKPPRQVGALPGYVYSIPILKPGANGSDVPADVWLLRRAADKLSQRLDVPLKGIMLDK